ncbi:uncharacterized protein SPPG_08494 [Spizellomyces punctatus DAOM BR117]|uniref:Vacuolar protein sorting-associated protein 62 n=1 Tax=Spizellomyces punctatus (strain DAOM BR117) TaxID=645134 RepID=A0A0L0H3R5_SPIPD|nr:uncharacterized protein SPPG_08494 [Spizellomyces punctatus DAOM BR117]KNC96105.1 hypothetical protein SPPG_08494 [Spizellomyces punctatus DAOM BR117]|eukprot:XP_016604145.1 hypothetical protein SPPG_08494 [Spizellomyces punctatus DAOM BR117]
MILIWMVLLGAASVSALPVLNTTVKTQSVCEGVPDFVLRNAPIVYLEASEKHFPGDPAEFLGHINPLDPTNNLIPGPTPITLANLPQYPSKTFLTAQDNVETDPTWLTNPTAKPTNLVSTAPSTLITVSKPNGITDAFWFLFYPFNHGPKVLGRHYGDHVGDWEHVLVRFEGDQPRFVYFSAHDGGKGLDYAATDKHSSGRPISYTARGSHANYPNNGDKGKHPYILPFGLLADITSDAKTAFQWDPARFYRAYCMSDGHFTAVPGTTLPDTDWLAWPGTWGDQQYPRSDKRQYELFGQWHYVSGPSGPAFKNLGRTQICENESKCSVAVRNTYMTMDQAMNSMKNASFVVGGYE